MIIAVTGSFGSGKSTVALLFKKYNFNVINVDKLYHGIYNKNKALRKKIKKEFGTTNRAELKEIVFKDNKKLRKLNSLTHPLIIKGIKSQISSIKKQSLKEINKKTIKNIKNKKDLIQNIKNKKNNEIKIILDIPLLFEAKATNLVDKIIVVKCNKKTQINRILKKKKYTKKEINQIIKSQMPIKEKTKKADFIVDNSFSLEKTKKQVEYIVKNLKI